jgi:hypothetical protein
MAAMILCCKAALREQTQTNDTLCCHIPYGKGTLWCHHVLFASDCSGKALALPQHHNLLLLANLWDNLQAVQEVLNGAAA